MHKILKDETRSKTILLLSEKGSMSYSELMNELGIVSTGLMNYHLKVLGDLVQKNNQGQYLLTDRGKLAARLMQEFPDGNSQAERKRRQRVYWSAVAASQFIILITVWALHLTGNIDYARAVQSTVAALSGVVLAYVGYKAFTNKPEPGSTREKSRMKVGYVLGGAWLGAVIFFIGPILISLISVSLGGPNILKLDLDPTLFISILLSLMIVGAIGGYYLGKRNNFEKPRWMTWTDEKFGF